MLIRKWKQVWRCRAGRLFKSRTEEGTITVFLGGHDE